MKLNVRWHSSDCSEPDVIVEDGVPCCQSCHATCSVLVEQLIAQNLARGGKIHLPADTPLREANFWWPRSVPYHRPRVDLGADSNPSMLSERRTKPNSMSSIYPSSLDSNHFRLIYITESEDISSPIHIRLAECDLNDHPEYETVSYVWGGEDCDSTPCKPIYVGRFWDIILATRNCSALLHYLRPQKGCRIIWLDAICINQADNIEKPAQISRMGDIYANCERVVAYFGEDLVSRPIAANTFRPRVDFRETAFADGARSDNLTGKTEDFLMTCANASGISQHRLLERRYLTRIWIVQELFLSKHAILPLGGSDILCDREQARRLILRTGREQLSSSSVTKSLSLLLKATSHCHASDPRDKVYGLLGLFQPEDMSQTLVSDYSISWRDCWVGTAAYLILVEKNLMLLSHAVGNTLPSCVPSWVPDIQSAGSWFDDSIPKFHEKHTRPPKHSARHKKVTPTASRQWKTEFVMYEAKRKRLRPADQLAYARQERHRLVHPRPLHTSSMKTASIASSNGALRLKAIRVFDDSCQLVMETEITGLTSIWVHGPSAAARFRVVGLKKSVDLDKSYQLFIMSDHGRRCYTDSDGQRPRPSRTVLLALTTALPGNDGSIVILHNCCVVYDVHFYSMDHLQACRGKLSYYPDKALHSLYWVLFNLREVNINSYAVEPGHDWIFAWIFPSPKATTRDILPLTTKLTGDKIRDKWSEYSVPLLAAATRICPDFEPDIKERYFYLKIKNEKMFSILFSMWEARRSHVLKIRKKESNHSRRYWREIMEVSFTYPRARPRDQWKRLDFSESDSEWSQVWSKRKFPFFIRFYSKRLINAVQRTTYYKAMCYAREFSKLFKEDLKTFLSRTPRDEDRCVFLEGWGRHLVEELGLVWKFERITIV